MSSTNTRAATTFELTWLDGDNDDDDDDDNEAVHISDDMMDTAT